MGEVFDFEDRRGPKVFSYFTGEVWKGDLTGRAVIPGCDPNPVPITGALEAIVADDGSVTGTVPEIRESFSCQGGPQSGVLDQENPYTGTKTAAAFILDLYGVTVTMPIVGTQATGSSDHPSAGGSGVFFNYSLDCVNCAGLAPRSADTIGRCPRDESDRLNDDIDELLRHLAQFLSRLDPASFDFGQWASGETQPDGSISMPYYVFSDQASELIAALPVTPGFAWPDWVKTGEAQTLLADHARIVEASADQLVKLTTAIVRSDRFTEGSIAGAFESGLLEAIVRRAKVLAATESG